MVTLKETTYIEERLGFFINKRQSVQNKYDRLEKSISADVPYLSEDRQSLSDCGRELSFYNDVIKMLEDSLVKGHSKHIRTKPPAEGNEQRRARLAELLDGYYEESGIGCVHYFTEDESDMLASYLSSHGVIPLPIQRDISENVTEKQVESFSSVIEKSPWVVSQDSTGCHINSKELAEYYLKQGYIKQSYGENVTLEHPVDEFICSDCGYVARECHRYVIDEDTGDESFYEFEFRYCPRCGMKVLKGNNKA